MKASAQKMNARIKNQVYNILHQVLNDCRNEEEVETVLKSLMSDAEIMALAKRLAIAVFLDKGHSYEHIKDVLKVSSATIASVADSMNQSGMQLALQKVKAERWAEEWSQKIANFLKKFTR